MSMISMIIRLFLHDGRAGLFHAFHSFQIVCVWRNGETLVLE